MSNIATVYLLNVPLENDYNNTLYFGSRSEQTSYFLSKVTNDGTFKDFNYQRKDNFIRIDKDFDELLRYNYVMYQNRMYSNKWFYCFITDIKYINDGVSHVYIETDVMQTWMFDISVKQSFVEREHVSDDTIGLHTVPESLEKGPYIINGYSKNEELTASPYIVIGSTVVPSGEGGYADDVGAIYNGIYSGVKYYAYPHTSITDVVQSMADNSKDDAISSIFLCPAFLQEQAGGGPVKESSTVKYISHKVDKLRTLNGYAPRNNKLKTDPYCYLLVSNGNGSVAKYEYEHFDFDDCSFAIAGALTPGCSIRLYPAVYKGLQTPETEGLNLGKYPQCNWATDQFTNWLTQNGVNIATSIVNAGVSMVGGAIAGSMAGGPIGTIGGAIAGGLSGATQIANTLNEVHKADLCPPQVQGNTNCGDVVTAKGDNTFHFYQMSIKKEYAQIIDKYFDCYGYKVNMMKIPNRNHRANYWYTKTIDVNITGAIPNNDMNKIKACYNKGITFWRNPSNIKDYSVENGIV